MTIKHSKSAVEILVETLSRPLESMTYITLPCSTTLTLKTRTHLGTTYELTSPPSSSPSVDIPNSMHFTLISELQSCILYILTLSLVSLIESYTPSSAPKSPDKDASTNIAGEVGWIPSLQVGEMTKSFDKLGRRKLLIVEVEPRRVGLRWGWMGRKEETGEFVWNGNDGENGEVSKAFREVVMEAGKYAR